MRAPVTKIDWDTTGYQNDGLDEETPLLFCELVGGKMDADAVINFGNYLFA